MNEAPPIDPQFTLLATEVAYGRQSKGYYYDGPDGTKVAVHEPRDGDGEWWFAGYYFRTREDCLAAVIRYLEGNTNG